MWFKNATLYGINPKFKFDGEALSKLQFLPITDLQMESSGWSEVRPGEMFLQVGKQVLLHFTQEKKHIPSSAVDAKLEERVADLEKTQGFAPGKKQRKELKERVTDELLPRALATRRRTQVWLDLESHRLAIDTSSTPVSDAIQVALNKIFETIGLEDITWPAQAVITAWPLELPADFVVDDEVSLRYPGESGKTVKFKSADPSAWDVQEHIQKHEAAIETLAMTYDSRVSFVMTDNAQIRRIKPLDILKDAEKTPDVDRFTNEFTLMAYELKSLIHSLEKAA